MTLRFRLVFALVALTTVGLAVFGVTTYSLYARTEHQRVDDTLRSSALSVGRDLDEKAGIDLGGRPDGKGNAGDPRGGPTVLVPVGTYAELRDANDKVLTAVEYAAVTTNQPKLAKHLSVGTFRTVDAAKGSGQWRVYAAAATGPAAGDTVVIAIPLGAVESSLHRLVLIETIAALSLLLLLAAGAWVVLRRGLQPLETMAESAASISAGDLSQRVGPSDDRTEVGQLGLALNTMLDEIEIAFREREATERRLRQFLADASHELRTPLTSIQGFAELFRLDTTHEHVDLPVILRRIEEEAARMRTLVEDLLLLARVDQARTPEQEPVDLAVLAADACSDAVATDPERAVTLSAPNPVVVRGDSDHLRQAVANLVANALRHTPSGTPIELDARVVDSEALLTVRDHGPGLDTEALHHAFDRFWQADAARAGSGVGLGLSIVAAIAAEHGGEATVTNAPDGGAAFTITLPVA